MISSVELGERYGSLLLAKACCPLCLAGLSHRPVDATTSVLECVSCRAAFLVLAGLPILLLVDENWTKKADEIEGEVLYNVRKIPPEVHAARNAFVDGNTEAFLKGVGVDLFEDDVLVVGCSMAELLFFAPRSSRVICLDIGPKLAAACREATVHKGIPAAWVCGDGECLPFEDESFDTVVVRQSLHHMLRYFSAICEFFRVCRRGGRVLIVDEPFSPPEGEDVRLLSGSDDDVLYGSVRLGDLRAKLGGGHGPDNGRAMDIDTLEQERPYIEPNDADPESLLADKYHSFSLISGLAAIRQHASSYDLIWPAEVAWTDESGEYVTFGHGPNPHLAKDLLDRILSGGNVSLAAMKTDRTRLLRKRLDLKPIPFAVARQLAGLP